MSLKDLRNFWWQPAPKEEPHPVDEEGSTAAFIALAIVLGIVISTVSFYLLIKYLLK